MLRRYSPRVLLVAGEQDGSRLTVPASPKSSRCGAAIPVETMGRFVVIQPSLTIADIVSRVGNLRGSN